MAQGRDSAVAVATLLLSTLLTVHSATFIVGGSAGWTFNVASWPTGKHFHAGDTLVFNYSPVAHNVVAVNKAGYEGCTVPSGAKTLQSGRDRIKLAKGTNYFICSVGGHCDADMRIAVYAA